MKTRAALVDAGAVAIALLDGVLGLYRNDGWEIAFTIIGAVGLLLRRRWPTVSLVIALPALYLTGGPIAAIIALYSLAASSGSTWRVVAGSVAVFVGVSGLWGGYDSINGLVLSLISATMTAGGATALGRLQRTRRALATSMSELRAANEVERERIAAASAARERISLAREMHDVVSHQVSLIAVQAGALQVTAGDDETSTTAREIRRLAATTLDELRHMVSVLRETGSRPRSIDPQPTITHLDDLLEVADLVVDHRIDLPPDLPPTIQRAIYRTIQEGLTNVRKHAPGARVTVSARVENGVVTVIVANSPGESPPDDPLPSAQIGLIGLNERAALLGGSVQTTLHPDGSHELRMLIPLEASP